MIRVNSPLIQLNSIRASQLRRGISVVEHNWLNTIEYRQTYPNNGIKFSHRDLLRPFDGRRDLLLVLLREERQNLRYYRIQPLRYLRLEQWCSVSLKQLLLFRDLKITRRRWCEGGRGGSVMRVWAGRFRFVLPNKNITIVWEIRGCRAQEREGWFNAAGPGESFMNRGV